MDDKLAALRLNFNLNTDINKIPQIATIGTISTKDNKNNTNNTKKGIKWDQH